jgi:hypothetical protein
MPYIAIVAEPGLGFCVLGDSAAGRRAGEHELGPSAGKAAEPVDDTQEEAEPSSVLIAIVVYLSEDPKTRWIAALLSGAAWKKRRRRVPMRVAAEARG